MSGAPRTYAVVVDDTPESRVALRFAVRRALSVGGGVTLLHVIPPADFVQWGGVQDMIEAEAQAKAETLLADVAEEVMTETGLRPSVSVRQGPPAQEVLDAISTDPDVYALVLGAASKGVPGPLIAFFTGEAAGQLPCPVIIVPGGMTDEAIDRLG
jgi:nucleotide-binding universal stress UspA family protein